jgi:hypothetical protein
MTPIEIARQAVQATAEYKNYQEAVEKYNSTDPALVNKYWLTLQQTPEYQMAERIFKAYLLSQRERVGRQWR